jgi:Cro/C1-type HTH DNA-binding domain
VCPVLLDGPEKTEEKKMNKSLLQRRSGVTMPTLLRYWDNDTQSVHLVSLERIARALRTNQVMTPETTYWKSIYHQERFLAAVPKLGKVWREQSGQFDTEYAAALYILTADSATWDSTESYADHDGIEFDVV